MAIATQPRNAKGQFMKRGAFEYTSDGKIKFSEPKDWAPFKITVGEPEPVSRPWLGYVGLGLIAVALVAVTASRLI